MTTALRTALASLSLVVLVACSPSTNASPSPSADASVAPSESTSPPASPTDIPGPGGGCPVVEQTGTLPSDRVTDIRVEANPTADLVTFVFGEKSTAPLNPTGKISAIEPPFSAGGSGEPVDVAGQHHVEIRLEGILFSNDDGSNVYQGEYRYDVALPALQALVNVDAFEGHFTWVAGYNGFGCVTFLANDNPNGFTIVFGH